MFYNRFLNKLFGALFFFLLCAVWAFPDKLHGRISIRSNITKKTDAKEQKIKSDDHSSKSPLIEMDWNKLLDRINKKNRKKFSSQKSDPEIILESADQGKFISISRKEGNILELHGRVLLTIGDRSIFANFITINMRKQEIFASGEVWLKEEDRWIQGQDMYFDRNRNVGVLYNIKGYMKPFLFQGKKIRQINRELSILDQGSMTTCDLKCPHYTFKVKKLWIYGDRKIFAHHATLYIGQIPIFYFPFFYQTMEGAGIITQLGQSDRQGFYMQNTVNIPFHFGTESSSHLETKWMVDFYQRMGEYAGFQGNWKSDKNKFFIRSGFARHLPVDYDSNKQQFFNVYQDDQLLTQYWYSLKTRANIRLFRDPWGEHSLSFDLDWYNHSYMFPFFDQRYEPRDTGDMLNNLFSPQSWSTPLYNLNWLLNYQRKTENSKFLLSLQKQWQWDQSKTFLDDEALYLPLNEKLPVLRFDYNEDFVWQVMDWQQVFTLGAQFTGENVRSYDALGERVHNYWQNNGFGYIAGTYNFLYSLFAFTPKIGYGWKKKIAFDGTIDQDEEAARNSYHYYSTEVNLRLGKTWAYLDNVYHYERSFASEKTVEPFFDERKNQWNWNLFLSPSEDMVFQARTAYDMRPGFLREQDRWSDIKTQWNWTIDFVHGVDTERRSFYKKYRLMFSRLHLVNNYNYILRYNLHGLNDLSVAYEIGNISWSIFNHIKLISAGLRWLHDFNNTLRDRLYFTWEMDFVFWHHWAFEMGGNSLVEQVYRYSKDVQPLPDIQNSMNMLNREKRNESLFRLDNFYVQLVHDLHCWEMVLGWRMSHRIVPFGVYLNNRLSYYEHIVYFSFRSKQMSSVGVAPTEIYRFKPDANDYN